MNDERKTAETAAAYLKRHEQKYLLNGEQYRQCNCNLDISCGVRPAERDEL